MVNENIGKRFREFFALHAMGILHFRIYYSIHTQQAVDISFCDEEKKTGNITFPER